ncbi:MAG: hypothetical protein IIB09_05165 [Bacteroidetes bacterium]|nr:hypothetical protein [Bacteroidota bacterium]
MSEFDNTNPFGSFDPVNLDPASDTVTSRVLVSGETGVSFDAIALFAEPMFQLYGLDPAEAFSIKHDPTSASAEMVTVLSTSRVLWAFFSLPRKERAHKRPLLAAHLVGDQPNEEDWLEIEGLLEAVEPYWSAMLPDEIQAAQDTGYPTLGFDDLLSHPAFELSEEPEDLAYGPDSLSEMEARALFAQPLLEDPAVMVDADAFEQAVERVNAYWHLATVPEARQEHALGEVMSQLSQGDGSSDAIRSEARLMVDRFHALFPKR